LHRKFQLRLLRRVWPLGVLLATLLLAVPACWGMWSSRVYLTAAAPLQTQAETTA